jgi:hypothetical protein
LVSRVKRAHRTVQADWALPGLGPGSKTGAPQRWA